MASLWFVFGLVTHEGILREMSGKAGLAIKSSALIAVLTLALGIGLLVAGTVSSDDIALFGLTVSPPIVQGVGLISAIFGVVTILTACRSLQPPTHAGRRGQVSDE